MKPSKTTISRRSFLRQSTSAVGAIVAAPLVISIPDLVGNCRSSLSERITTGLSKNKPDALPLLGPEAVQTAPKSSAQYALLRPAAAESESAPTIVDCIPFFKNMMWTSMDEGDGWSISYLNIKAAHLYLSGCVNSVDKPHNNWGGADDFKNQYVGDNAGYLKIKYRSGAIDSVPLIFGYTLWWREGYNSSPQPFKSESDKQAILNRALCVANGIHGGEAPYYLRIDLRDEPVLEIELKRNVKHAGHPVIDGITFGGVADAQLLNLARFFRAHRSAMPNNHSAWLASHSVASNDSLPRSREDALRNLSRLIYTFPGDISALTINQTKSIEIEHTFSRPEVTFCGPPEAAILANVFLENVNGLLDRVDNDTGMVHESAYKAANYSGWVGYEPDVQAYFDDSYTRTHFILLLSNMGFLSKAEKAIGYFDQWMMYFPKSYPTLQMGGKPVPGHATVIANKPHIYFDKLSKLGWPTKYTRRDYGNPETDGHGILMLSRWRTWSKAGKNKEWVNERWDAINEAAEWIPWCLDNPELSFSEHGLLYSESEGGLQMESLYCNVPCYFGLVAYAEMAEVAGRVDVARRWRAQAERLLSAMNTYFPSTLDQWGDVWDPKKVGGWGLSSTTVPLFEGMELYGYDAVSCLPTGWAERTKRTYIMQSAKRSPRFCDPSAMGYGQGFITQSALLLDQMNDATHMTKWMARFCFAPRQPHPYRVPESVIMKSNGSMWARGGDLGNGFQMGEVLLACQILLGIDDYGGSTLKLMPRLPIGWTGVSVQHWPVRVLSSGKSEMVMVSMELVRDKDCKKCNLKITVDKPIDNVSIRLGPFPLASKTIVAKDSNGIANPTLFESGDCKWAWIHTNKINNSYLIQSRVK